MEPLDLDQWEFYVLPTGVINERLGNRQEVSLAGLKAIGAAAIGFGELREAVERAAAKD